uniref:Tn3 family transposase n=1 Tax=Cytobacillus firmus TaxID=1399 RepID=UPI001F1F69EE
FCCLYPLYEMLPRIKLTDLLLEVASWTGFHEQFIHASSNKLPNTEEKNILLSALILNMNTLQK